MSDEKPTYVDWEAVAKDAAFERRYIQSGPDRDAWFESLIAQHTHPAPEGLAARMLEFIAERKGARKLLADATPAAVAALDRAMEEVERLQELCRRAGHFLGHAHDCGDRQGQDCTCAMPFLLKELGWSGLGDMRDPVAEENVKLRAALVASKTGSCWCPVGIGAPYMREHSPNCVDIQRLVGSAM